MSGHRAGLKRRLQALLKGSEERTPALATNTQFLIQLSGYRWIVTMFGPLSGKWVLDAASGEGFGSEVLAREGAQVVGIDIDDQVVALATRRYPRSRFLCMDVSALGFQDETFDLVISQDTLEHVEEDVAFINEVHRVLKPGGIFIVFTPHAPSHTTRPANPYHLREYSRESLLELLSSFFPSIQLFGRRPRPSLQEAEESMDRLRCFDPLGLRRLLVPRFLRHTLGSWWVQIHGARRLDELTVEDVEYFEGAEGSGTLIALCRKQVGNAGETEDPLCH